LDDKGKNHVTVIGYWLKSVTVTDYWLKPVTVTGIVDMPKSPTSSGN